METLHLITRCTRPQNLLKIKESIESIYQYYHPMRWHIVFDTSVIQNIDSTLLSELNSYDVTFIRGEDGDFGHGLINKTIEKIESDDFIYILDDDNILHPDLYTEIYNTISQNPDKRGFVFNQKVGGKDFSGLDIRLASPENMFVSKIDSAQFVLKRSLIGLPYTHVDFSENIVRFRKNEYKADGYFIEEIYKKNPSDFVFIDKVLCYYNFIEPKKSNSLPRVLVVGASGVSLDSKFYADFESIELNVLCKNDDSDIDSVIQEFNPDSILSIGDDYSKFTSLTHHSYDIRKRWIHQQQVDSNSGESAYQCANNFILNAHYDDEIPLISFFTPIYNTGDKLYRTYMSVRSQSYKNWEWVLVNDSTDGGKTLKVAEDIASKDSRVKVYDFGKKSGGIVGESKYRAAALCNGKYLMELDHDDCILPEAGYYMVEAFKKYPDAKFVYSDCSEIDESHNSLTYGDGFAFGYGSYRDEEYNGRVYKVANSPSINPKTIRHIVGVPNHFRAWDRLFYHSIGGHNRRLSIADDYELIIRTFLKTRMVRVPKLLYLQFYHNANTQNATRKDIQRRVRSISNFYNDQIHNRFIELGYQDWAYDNSPHNPLMSESRLNQSEANYTYNEDVVDLLVSYNL